MLASLMLLLYKNTEMGTCQKKWLKNPSKNYSKSLGQLQMAVKKANSILDISKGADKKKEAIL